MLKLTIRHDFDCDEDTFWDKTFLDPDFTRSLMNDKLNVADFAILESNSNDAELTRRLRAAPRFEGLPGPLKKLLGDKFSYEEKGRFDKKTRRYTFETIPSVKPDKITNRGVIYCEKRDGGITRVAEIELAANIMLVGKLLEERFESELRTAYDKAAEYTRQRLAELAKGG